MRTAQGLLVWFISTLFVIYAFCLNTAAAVFSNAIQSALHLSKIELSYAMSAFIAGFAMMQIPAGYLLDRFNTKWIVCMGILILALGNLFIASATDFTLFTVANFIQGVGGSFAFIAAAVLISNWFKPQLFPILFGLTQTLSCVLAGMIHYAFMTALLTHPWSAIYRVLALFGFCLLVLSALFIRSPKTETAPDIPSLGKALKSVCSNPQIWLCALAAATSFGVLLAYGAFWFMNIQTFYSLNTNDSLSISGLIFVGVGLGTPLMGYLSNVLHSRKLVIHVSVSLGVMMLMLGIYLPHFKFTGLLLIDMVSFLIGFFLSGSMLFYTVVSEISTNSTRGVALSLTNTCVFLFNTLLMFLPYAFITDASPHFYTYLWTLPMSVMICILLFYFIKESYQGE